ncbi:DUF3515 domain-containing protein [uncultured Jatrophihabitans sp.]|uniref:DUF3515 domain-containing protein n=1 Tax=uncultured Jatrophihabitans sp. TaxID=1610747 RepID=UPI0035CA0C72
MTLPIVVIGAFAIVAATNGGGSSSNSSPGPGSPLTPSAPPNATRQAAACTKVLAQLPVQLGTLAPRVVRPNPPTAFVVAWGNPAVILSCGAARPKSLHPGSSTQYFQNGTVASGPYFDATKGSGGRTDWITVDRAAYISISVPPKYQGSTVLPPLSDAIAKALPAVCGVPDNNGKTSLPLCTQRK